MRLRNKHYATTAREAGAGEGNEEMRGVVSSTSFVDSPAVAAASSSDLLRLPVRALLSFSTGCLQTGQVRFPSVSQGSTHLQWYAKETLKISSKSDCKLNSAMKTTIILDHIPSLKDIAMLCIV